MKVRISMSLESEQGRLWIDLGSGFMDEDGLWYVCVWHNGRQPRAPMNRSEAYDEFHRRRDEYLAQGWKIVREVVWDDIRRVFHPACALFAT